MAQVGVWRAAEEFEGFDFRRRGRIEARVWGFGGLRHDVGFVKSLLIVLRDYRRLKRKLHW
jgi:hypothetical protein